MIKLYIYCSVLIIGNVEVGPDIGMKFHQEVMEIVSYDINKNGFNCTCRCLDLEYCSRSSHIEADFNLDDPIEADLVK